MKNPIKKRMVLLCAVEPDSMVGITDRYALAGTYGFEYLKASVETDKETEKKYQIKIVRNPAGTLDDDMVDAAVMEDAFAAGFSVSMKNLRRAMSVARQMKLAKPGLIIIVGGPQAFAPERILKEYGFVDYAVSGEGEKTFCELLDSIDNPAALEKISGLTWRDGEGIVVNEQRAPRDSLAELPRVITKARMRGLSGVALYESSRGCRHSCSYCLWSPYPKRYFSVKRVKSELLTILDNPDISRIWFVDSDFDSDTERAEEILHFISENNPHDTKVSAFLSFDNPTKGLLVLVGKLFYEVPVGLQTIKMNLQKALGRSWFEIEKFDAALSTILDHIPAEKLYMDLMYGLPGELPGDFFDTVLWCVSRGLTHLNFFRLGVYPGTRLEEYATRNGLVFDPSPPHFVYRSKTFSYDDIIQIEHAAINYRILSGVFDREQLTEMARQNTLIPAMKKLRKNNEKWAGCYQIIDETNICNLDIRRAAELVAAEGNKNRP